MRREMLVRVILTAALLGPSVAEFTLAAAPDATPGGAPARYWAVEIPGVPEQGYNYVFPADINNRGVVVGALERLPGYVPVRAFLWTGAGPVRDLGDLGVYEFAQAVAVNDADQVIGVAKVIETKEPRGVALHGFFWEQGVMTDLPPLGGDLESQAVAINELGDVLVVSFDDVNPAHDRYYIWRHGRVDQLGRLNAYPGGPAGAATAMNNFRQIVGSVAHQDGQERAFLWDEGRMIDLGLAPGDDFYSAAYHITDSGLIVGESAAFDDQNGHGARSQGVVWLSSVFVRTVAPLADDYMLAGLSVNQAGTVVGFSGFPQDAIVSFGGPAINLNDLIVGRPPRFPLGQASDVNERGQIIGDGMFGCCGYLLNPM